MAGDNQYVQLRKRLRNLAKMREQGTLTPEEYDEQVALITDGDPYEEMFTDAGSTLKPPTSPSSVQGDPAMSLPHEEAVRHYLKQTAEHTQKQTQLIESIKGWVMFFGLVTLMSLVAWVIFILRQASIT